MSTNEKFYQRLTRLFRSGPAIQRKIKGTDSRGLYSNQLIQGNYGYKATAPFGFGRENSPFSVLGSYGVLDRISRYSEFEEMCYCLHGDTKIAVPGGYKTIKELTDEYGMDKEFIVYSYDHNKKQLVPAIGKQARLTKHDTAYKVTFENGQELIGTADHRLMKRDGTYCTIEDLKSGDAMMPFYRKDLFSESKNDSGNGYRWIYTMNCKDSTVKNGWTSEHKLIAEWANERKIQKDEVVHHINFNKHDNTPGNLVIMNKEDHFAFHSKLNNDFKWSKENQSWIDGFKTAHSKWMKENNPNTRPDITFQKILQWCEDNTFNLHHVMFAFNTNANTIKNRLKQSGFENFQTFAKAYNQNWKSDSWNNAGSKNPRFNHALTFEKICDTYKSGMKLIDVKKLFGVSHIPIAKRLKENGFKNWTDFTNSYANHKVLKVEYYGNIPLYDLTVDGYKNFATDSVISHNSPEIASALDIYADETIGGDERGKSFHIYSKNSEVKTALDDLFYDIINVEFNLRVWVRNMIKYGDFFLFNEVAPDLGIIAVSPIPVNEIEREEGFDLQDPYAVRFRWLTRGNKYLENWQVVHLRIMNNDLFLPYGTSILEPARRTFRQLMLLEDAMLVYRVVRCLHGESKIWTKSGYKNIQDIKVGDLVYSFDVKSQKLRETKVLDWVNNGAQEIWSIASKHRSLKANNNHPLLVKNKKTGVVDYVQVKDLIPKVHQVVMPKNHFSSEVPTPISLVKENYEWFGHLNEKAIADFKAKKFGMPKSIIERKLAKKWNIPANRVHQFLYGRQGHIKGLPVAVALDIAKTFEFDESCVITNPKGMFNLERLNLPKTIDSRFARFFGFMLGDGFLTSNLHKIGFATGINKETNDYYKTIFENYCGSISFSHDNRNKNPILGKYETHNFYFASLMRDMGFTSSVYTKTIPSWIFSSNHDIKKEFIRGLIDADGHIRTQRKTESYELELCNKNLVDGVKELCHQIGWNVSRKVTKRTRKSRNILNQAMKCESTTSYSIYITEQETPLFEDILTIEKTGETSDVFDIRVEDENHNFIADGIVVHNSPERRAFFIDVGNIPPADVENYMEAAKATLRSQSVMDKKNGREDMRLNAMSVLDDFFIPVRGQQTGTRIETLGGASHATDIEDVEYIQKKLFAALKVPKPYLNYDENLSSKASLSQMDVRFSRTISGMQKTVISELNKLAMIHLFAMGFDKEDLIDFELRLSNPSSIAMQQKLELWSSKFDIGGTAKETKLVDERWVQRNILELSEGEIDEIEQGLLKDKLRTVEIDNAEPEPPPENAPAKTTDLFNPVNYLVPGEDVSKAPQKEQSEDAAFIFGKPGEENIDDSIARIDLSKEKRIDSDGNSYIVNLEDEKSSPIKVTPFMNRNKKNRSRRVGQRGRSALGMPDHNAMLSNKNKYNRDINGTKTERFDPMNNEDEVLYENEMDDEVDNHILLEPNINRDMSSMLEKMKQQLNIIGRKSSNGILKESPDDVELSIDIIEEDPMDGLLLESTVNSNEKVDSNVEDEVIEEKSLQDIFKSNDD